MLGRWIREREVLLSQVDKNRIVRPFEWGEAFIGEHANGTDPRAVLREHAACAMANSDEFYRLPEIRDYHLEGNRLTWTSAVATPSSENNTVRATYFPLPPDRKPKSNRRSAVLILPQWNAQPESHVALGHLFNRLGMSALRLTMPYHEERRPAELERADFLVCSNIGRTIQSIRQAVLDSRAAIEWLAQQGFERIGIIGTSIGSCTAFLTFIHDERVDVGVFNHVSGYFADVVWKGISTQHVRAGFGDEVTLEELREFWHPISPLPFVPRLKELRRRPMRFIAARYDLTFPADLSREVIREVKKTGAPLSVKWLPCGHYTSAEKPWIYLDGWKIATFFRRHL